MFKVFLTKIKTSDGVTLDGIYVKPKKRTHRALVWVHGLTSRFSSGQVLIQELSSQCQKAGIGYFKFNSRGHDIAASGNKKQKIIGGGFERFEECVLDIRAIILFAKKTGYKNFILAGSSTGANKVLYYLYKTKDPCVKAIILAAPVSDIPVGRKLYGTRGLARRISLARRMSIKNPLMLMPSEFGLYYSPRRFLSLFTAGSAEDVVPYHNPNAKWKELISIRIPIAVIFGSRDQYLDRPAKKLIEIFRSKAKSTKNFSGIIIKGARHSFQKKEKELAQAIIKWIKSASA